MITVSDAGDVARLGVDIRAEERRRDHGQREPVHFHGEVDLCAGALGLGP